MLALLAAVPFCAAGLDVAREYAARRPRRRAWYDAALARSRQANKPLLVIGDPDGGWTHGDHGYGDVYMDLTGCPKAPRGIRHNIQDRLPFANDSHVVFVCYVLELVPDIAPAFRELRRVAGPDLFVLALHPSEIAAYKYPGTRWAVSQAPCGDRRALRCRAIDRSRVGVRFGDWMEVA